MSTFSGGQRWLGVAALAILAMLLTMMATQRESSPHDDRVGQALFAGLESKLNGITGLTLASGGTTTTIEQDGDAWVVAERSGYPASFTKVSRFVNGLAEATYVERKTAKPENFAMLGVGDNGLLASVTIGEEVRRLLVGEKSSGVGGHFVRFPDEDQVWLADGLTEATADPATWIDPAILNLDAEHVIEVIHTASDGSELIAVRDEETNDMIIPALPADQELEYDTIANTLSRALVNVRLTDVRPRGGASEGAWEGAWENAGRAEYRIDDGSRIIVATTENDAGQFWLRVDVSTAQVPAEAVSGLDSDRLARWEFMVSQATFERFNKTMSDMIKAEPENPQ